ncbi:MAG: aminoacyl-tRNA hydrolase [Gammaproteobacteria bacterium]|nr:aminoacyl-tRNA hydrolase [Gammaproteobacteria bacterium]MDH5777156.1 aminoacyl-tRNA hydrolase [Gammaproteobacteria bacterium]
MSGRVQMIVGLGNPGREYQDTRHNAGFWFVDELARQNGASFNPEKKFQGEAARCRIDGEEVWLLKPQTFMNLSGQSVQALANFYKIPLEAILVVHDELDLDAGVVRLKDAGGHGGHNGLRDIIQKMGSNKFIRLRIGIGHPGDKSRVTGHVLNKVSQDDRIEIERAIDNAIKELPAVVAGDLAKAMNRLHSK